MTDKKTCEVLIDRLADKTLSFGCRIMVKKCKDEHAGMFNASIKAPCEIMSNGGFSDRWEIIHYCNNFGDICSLKEEGEIDKILGHPVMIGDVLEKLKSQRIDEQGVDGTAYDVSLYKQDRDKVLDLWEWCGYVTSLNEIIEKSWYTCEKQMTGSNFDTECKFVSKLKDPQARELVEFILSLNLE